MDGHSCIQIGCVVRSEHFVETREKSDLKELQGVAQFYCFSSSLLFFNFQLLQSAPDYYYYQVHFCVFSFCYSSILSMNIAYLEPCTLLTEIYRIQLFLPVYK